jgi:Pentapeptide repeats (8 copies)
LSPAAAGWPTAKFEWRDASGNVRSRSDLEQILREHKQWIESEKKAGTQADLHDAKLDNARLVNVDLYASDMGGAKLNHAILSVANISHSNLGDADLSAADLDRAILSGTRLTGANLTGADLTDANLTGATLTSVNFTHTKLIGTDLTEATADEANFDGAVFEAKSLPALRGISRAKNLELLTYKDNPVALVLLRKQFEEGGFREQERKITYALRRREAELSWARGNFASFTFNNVLFDWTCQYGMSPGRPLMLGVVLWFLCSVLYFVCIHTSGEAGLYRVDGPSVRDNPAQPRVERISPLNTTHPSGPRGLFQFFRREGRLLGTSMFFSLMSAFNIGFRDINFGRWLRLLTRQEFDIKPVGWARVIAGWQSLISVYLIALWVLTYFGRPFD